MTCYWCKIYHILFPECPRSPDHMERFACPRPDRRGRFRCIDDRALCDGFYDCPDKEDENPDHCLFYKTVRIFTERFIFWWLSSFLVMKFGQENHCSWMIFPMWFCELNCNSGTNFFADQGTSRHPGRGPVTMGEGPLRDHRARSPHTFQQQMNCFLRFVI